MEIVNGTSNLMNSKTIEEEIMQMVIKLYFKKIG